VVDVGSGSGFDAFVASQLVGPKGWIVVIDMTSEMLFKARSGAKVMNDIHSEGKIDLRYNLVRCIDVSKREQWGGLCIVKPFRLYLVEFYCSSLPIIDILRSSRLPSSRFPFSKSG
jgi:protein-L-isoaspartate O-methyltransferase